MTPFFKDNSDKKDEDNSKKDEINKESEQKNSFKDKLAFFQTKKPQENNKERKSIVINKKTIHTFNYPIFVREFFTLYLNIFLL